jgi:hypothetical protein
MKINTLSTQSALLQYPVSAQGVSREQGPLDEDENGDVDEDEDMMDGDGDGDDSDGDGGIFE